MRLRVFEHDMEGNPSLTLLEVELGDLMLLYESALRECRCLELEIVI